MMTWYNFEIEFLREVVNFCVVSKRNCCESADNPQNNDQPENKILKSYIFVDKLDFKSPLESLEICLTQPIELFNFSKKSSLD